MRNTLLPLLFLVLANNAAANYCEQAIPYLKEIIVSSPSDNATSAFDNQNNKFLAIFGFSYNIPGVTPKQEEKLLKDNSFTAIEGSGDNLCVWDTAPNDLQTRIYNYAKIYNETLSKFIFSS